MIPVDDKIFRPGAVYWTIPKGDVVQCIYELLEGGGVDDLGSTTLSGADGNPTSPG